MLAHRHSAIGQPLDPFWIAEHGRAPDALDLFLDNVEHVGNAVKGWVFAGASPCFQHCVIDWLAPAAGGFIGHLIDDVKVIKRVG